MSVEDEVRALSAVRDAVLVRNDAPLIASFMTDDWVYVGPSGVTSKADIIGWIASGRLVHHTMAVVGGDRVAVAGNTVLFTAHRRSSGIWDGVSYETDEWMTEVYVHENHSWRCALSHKSEAASG